MLALLAVVLAQNPVTGNHPTPPPVLQAAERRGNVTIDGRLDEAAWQAASAATEFRQSLPNEGQAGTQRTEVRFLFDGDALYVGAKMYDSLGAAGVRTRLVRRDQLFGEADQLSVIFDTFHDHLGRTEFVVNPSGVKMDGYGPGGSNPDYSWDPVYEAAAAIDGEGWTAELRIPLSQLRFPTDSVQTWGLQIVRFASRLNERTHWAWWANNESGGPSRYGHLEGLALGKPTRGLEILPYAVAQQTRRANRPSNHPFIEGSENLGRVGLDMTYRLTTNLTLSATMNPDFGQVEVDPAVVNLGVFETFFPERRPFFIEGAGLFRFGGLNCYTCSNASGLSSLHSRRIGRTPQGGFALPSGVPSDVPDNATILGAAKITGRTPSGWSIGVLNAVTARERADVQDDINDPATRRQIEVEPFTNYFAGRIARDLRGGNTQLRLMVTSVVRDNDSALATRLNSHSELVGFETDNWFKRRTWRLMTTLAISNNAGDTAAIRRLQQSSARYFQRPDRGHGSNGFFSDAYDPQATRLGGYMWYTRFSKEAGDWIGEAQVNIRSPGFEANDLAFNTRSDFVWWNGNIRRRWTRPSSWYRWFQITVGGQYESNFDGDMVSAPQVQTSWYMDMLNYWYVGMYGHIRFERADDKLTRGGPIVNRPRDWFINWFSGTDARKRVVVGYDGYLARNTDNGLDLGTGGTVQFKPASNVSLSFGPYFNRLITRTQYVRGVADPTATLFAGTRHVFADLDQRSLSMNTRVNVTFSPRMSLEVFLQPLISSGGYRAYKEFARPRSTEKLTYGRDVGTIQFDTTAAGVTDTTGFRIDPDGGGPASSFRVDRPDFSFRSLRGNAILRWEFRPGSTLYFVWAQSRASQVLRDRMLVRRDLDGMVNVRADNVFLVKMSWWIGL